MQGALAINFPLHIETGLRLEVLLQAGTFIGIASAKPAVMKKIMISLGILALVVAIAYANRAWSTYRVNARTSKFNEDVENLFAGLQKYKERVGSYPFGGNADVVKALQGNNSKNVIVIVGRNTPINDKGEFVDPWGTPLKIYFSDVGVLIRSAGPNRRFDDSTVMEADDFIRSN